ncbi:MAG: hypothetical protein ABI343_03305 [Burkholderiaceae bacterium]
MKIHAPHRPAPEELPEVDLDDPEYSLGADSDDGLTAPMISEDPEHDRLVDPEY